MSKLKKCLSVRIKDREFFTKIENKPKLLEFAKMFGAKLSIVNISRPDILNLKKLAEAISISTYENKNDSKAAKRTILIKQAASIRGYIEKQFLQGKIVSLKDLKSKFEKQKLTDGCFCNHMSQIRKKLMTQGHKIKKVGGGKYQLTNY